MYSLSKYIICGSTTSFYSLKNMPKYGFKSFYSKDEAEYARKIQVDLSRYNLAPKVYSEVGRIRIGKKRKHFSSWGYITEKADMIGCGGNECECGECEDDLFRDEIDRLTDDIEECGYYFSDNHIGNVGYVQRGDANVLVCIDTGGESVQEIANNSCNCVHCQNRRYSYA